jgi:nitroreductase
MEEFVDVHYPSQSVTEAIMTRHSVREFSNKPIPDNIIKEIMSSSLRAPSWKNIQPWKINVVTGNTRNSLSSKLVEAATSSSPNPETMWLDTYPSNAKKRMFDIGMKVYGVAGIDRKDKQARDEFMLNNFRFFQAPTVLILTTNFELNFFVGIDLGCYVESVLLLAREHGLGTCAQAALGAFPQVVKEELDLPADEKVIMGISIGYPKEDSNLNRFHSPREEADNLIRYYS